ncbi:MAG: hypothetical protein AB7O97_05995 [Planctomycetota bacterium]
MSVIRPVTAEQVEAAIQRTGWAAYLYLGSADDVGWENAQLIDDDPGFPKLRVYRVEDLDEVDCWAHGETTGGLVITDKGRFSTHIDRRATESLIDAILAIADVLGGR